MGAVSFSPDQKDQRADVKAPLDSHTSNLLLAPQLSISGRERQQRRSWSVTSHYVYTTPFLNPSSRSWNYD